MRKAYPNILSLFLGLLVFVLPSLAWSMSACDDEFLTLFSSAEYKVLIDKYPPAESKEVVNNPTISIGLAAMYQWGIGTESSQSVAGRFLESLSENEIEQTINHWKSCAKTGNVAARILLGIVYYDGLGVGQNLDAAKHCFDALSAPIARLGLAATYHRLGRNDFVDSLINNVIRTSPGIDAFKVAELYYHGIIFDQDYRSAVKWYEKSADEGSYYALGILGYMYANGLGVEKSQEKGRYWFDRQSEHPDFKVDNSRPVVSDIYSNKKN